MRKKIKFPKFKIITEKEYKELKNEAKATYDMYIDETTQLMTYNQELEHRLQMIDDKLVDILNSRKATKDKIIKKLTTLLDESRKVKKPEKERAE